MSAETATGGATGSSAPAWLPLAKKEFNDTIRSRAVLILSALLFVFFVVPVVIGLYTDFTQGQAVSAILLQGQSRITSVVVPLAGIAFGYAAISGERQSGSIKLLLSLPYDRLEVLIGKFVGRSAAVLAPLVGALILQNLVAIPELSSAEGSLEFSSVVVFIALTAALAVVFVGFAVGVSAATSTTRRSLAIVGGIWAYFFLLWNNAAQGLGGLLRQHTEMEALTTYKVELFAKLLNPTQTYQSLLASFTGSEEHIARLTMFSSLRQQIVAQELEGSVPWYLSDGVAVAILAFWLVVPLAVGYYFFSVRDL